VSEDGPPIEHELRAVVVGELRPLEKQIEIRDYDDEWPRRFQREAKRIRAALGDAALQIEHTGSTSVPGLAAKPIIDIVLVVEDTTDEDAYVPALEAAGYVLRIREPDWYEHRMFREREINVNLHVFPRECEEVDKMLLFRDWLRENETDRRLYERTKRELAQRKWTFGQEYANAKTAAVEEIVARARAG
jgi:GrpB-like predicted nucleotidyltransferase (UPF0157 family)